jgi:mannose-1-phosphate guanylyltransferase
LITDAIILAGGLGLRLRPLTLGLPKPLLPVNNRPFLETQFMRLKAGGVRRVTLSIFHQADKIKKALPGLKKFGLKVALAREKEALGTGGAIRFAWPDPARSCLVLNGDILSDAGIAALQKAHQASQAMATLWLVKVPDPSRFGVVELSASGRVLKFVEKPAPGVSRSQLINAGLYALEPQVLGQIALGRPVSVEREVFPALLAAGCKLQGFRDSKAPYWKDIGNPEAYLDANLDAASGRVKLKGFWPRARRGSALSGNVIGPRCQVAADASLKECLLLEGVRVGSQANLRRVILGQGVVVAAGRNLKEGEILTLKGPR